MLQENDAKGKETRIMYLTTKETIWKSMCRMLISRAAERTGASAFSCLRP